jgi:outer membrane immunogenic protein
MDEGVPMQLYKVALSAVTAFALGAVATSANAGGDLKGDYRSSSIWTGAYWGVHLGGGDSHIDWLFTPVHNTRADHSGDGVVGGVHLGYNWQLSGLVLGIEGSATFSGINGGRLCPDATVRCEHEIDFLGSVRGRLGVAVGSTLLYGTGGVGFQKADYAVRNATTGFVLASSGKDMDIGWVAGGGIEYAITRHVSARIEYLHYDFGDKSFEGREETIKLNPTIDTVTAGLSVKF